VDDVRAEIEINASPERVWKVLTDFSSYSSWNPLITSAGGTAKTDSVLTLRLQPPQSRTLRVLHYERLRQIRWRGAAWGVPLLLSSEQSFTLEALPDGRTKVVQQAAATGLLRPDRPFGPTCSLRPRGHEPGAQSPSRGGCPVFGG